MARTPIKTAVDAVDAEAKAAVYVLDKGFGTVQAGAHKLWAKGSEFVAGVDDEIIAMLHRMGAAIRLK